MTHKLPAALRLLTVRLDPQTTSGSLLVDAVSCSGRMPSPSQPKGKTESDDQGVLDPNLLSEAEVSIGISEDDEPFNEDPETLARGQDSRVQRATSSEGGEGEYEEEEEGDDVGETVKAGARVQTGWKEGDILMVLDVLDETWCKARVLESVDGHIKVGSGPMLKIYQKGFLFLLCSYILPLCRSTSWAGAESGTSG